MQKLIRVRRGLPWAFAALLAVAVPTVQAVSDSAAARSKLSAELPHGVTLAAASVDQTAAAIRSAVAKDPGMATSILASGLMAKMPKRHHGEESCDDVAKMTQAAIASDTRDASSLIETASSIRPGCADALNALLTNPGTTADVFDVASEYAFGAGFGPGFPGSPGFVGSPPSGAIALPPTTLPTPSPTPVTSVTP